MTPDEVGHEPVHPTLVKKEKTIRTVLTALHFPPGASPSGPPKEAKLSSPRTLGEAPGWQEASESTDWPEYPDRRGREDWIRGGRVKSALGGWKVRICEAR